MALDTKLTSNIVADTLRSTELKASSGQQAGGSGQANSFTVTPGGNLYDPNYYNNLQEERMANDKSGLTPQEVDAQTDLEAEAKKQAELASGGSVMDTESNDADLLNMIPGTQPTWGSADKQQVTGSDVKSFLTPAAPVEKEIDPIHGVYKEWSAGEGQYKDIKTWGGVKSEFYGTDVTNDMGGPASQIETQSLQDSDFGISSYIGSLNPSTAAAVQLEKDRIAKVEADKAAAAAVTNGVPYRLRGSQTESSIKAANLNLTYYKVNPETNEYITETGAVRSQLAWSPEAMRGYDPEKMSGKSLFNSKQTMNLSGADQFGQNAQTATKFETSFPKSGQAFANTFDKPINAGLNTDVKSNENPNGGEMEEFQPEFDNPKGGPSWISTAALDAAYGPGKGQSGVQEQYNMQNANRAFNIILKDWRSDHMTKGYTAKTDQAKSTAKANAQGFIFQKKMLIDSWQGDGTSNGKFNDYKKMFKSDLDTRFKNMYSNTGTLYGSQERKVKDDYTKYSSTKPGGNRVVGDKLIGGGGTGFGYTQKQNLTRQPNNSTSTNPYLFDLNKAGSFSSADGKKIKPKLMTWKDTGFY